MEAVTPIVQKTEFLAKRLEYARNDCTRHRSAPARTSGIGLSSWTAGAVNYNLELSQKLQVKIDPPVTALRFCWWS